MRLTIAQMLTKPGHYIVMGKNPALFSVVEVEPDGTCHQIKSQKHEDRLVIGPRDGVLAPDGWNEGAFAYGPLTQGEKVKIG